MGGELERDGRGGGRRWGRGARETERGLGTKRERGVSCTVCKVAGLLVCCLCGWFLDSRLQQKQ